MKVLTIILLIVSTILIASTSYSDNTTIKYYKPNYCDKKFDLHLTKVSEVLGKYYVSYSFTTDANRIEWCSIKQIVDKNGKVVDIAECILPPSFEPAETYSLLVTTYNKPTSGFIDATLYLHCECE